MRLANRSTFNEYEGHFEIVSITGTVSTNGSHIHVSISDGDGVTIGGHLVSGCKIYTTAEIVIAEFDDVIYKRCLLYTSDAADERSSVDLGGRRIIKKKHKDRLHAAMKQ